MEDKEKFAQLERRVQLLENDSRDLQKTIEPIKIGNAQNEVKYNQIMDTLKEVRDDVKSFKERPSKFWDFVLMTGIAAIINFVFKFF